LRRIEEARDEVRREHQSAVADVTRLTERAAAEREAAAARQTDLEARLSSASEKIEVLEQTVAETRAAGVDAERRLAEETNAFRAAALVQAAGFDDQFDEQRRQYERRLAEDQDMRNTLAGELVALQAALRTTQEESDRLDREHRAERDRLEQGLTTASAANQQLAADLHQELHQSRADNHRLFQQAPLPMFRCTKDGVLTQANRLLALLVGHRSPDDLRGAEFAASVFESPSDLSWLIERCLGSRGKESTETTWRRKDGIRLLVRLSACATSSDLIECGVEDLTPVRVLKDRLGEAHRMEAVGRLAAEVAVACGNLLRGIHQDAQQWLMTDGSPTASRQQRGEKMLEEISRAAGLLRQLAAYGDEESRRPAMVELSTVVRDIAPVLKRVAGDGVDVQLPAPSAPLNVDAGAECVQRLLVNVAAYGRKRMPSGGRLKIELGTIVVDRHFTAKHPNVRLGRHALVTVTESRRTARTDGILQLHDTEGQPSSQSSAAVQTSVDLGTLQELVGDCGGHLWMTVQPLGDMVIKIRLPLLTPYGQPPRRTLASGTAVRTITHWFQH
jgi:PAS domain-containing protein